MFRHWSMATALWGHTLNLEYYRYHGCLYFVIFHEVKFKDVEKLWFVLLSPPMLLHELLFNFTFSWDLYDNSSTQWEFFWCHTVDSSFTRVFRVFFSLMSLHKCLLSKSHKPNKEWDGLFTSDLMFTSGGLCEVDLAVSPSRLVLYAGACFPSLWGVVALVCTCLAS